MRRAATDDQGRCVLEALPEGQYTVERHDGGAKAQASVVESQEARVELR